MQYVGAEILIQVYEWQREMYRDGPVFHPTSSLAGKCQRNRMVRDELGGQVYSTQLPSERGPWGHTVGVVLPAMTNEAMIIDLTQTWPNGPLVGLVSCAENPEKVAQELAVIFGVGGWQLLK